MRLYTHIHPPHLPPPHTHTHTKCFHFKRKWFHPNSLCATKMCYFGFVERYNRCNKFKLWQFWECYLYEISEYEYDFEIVKQHFCQNLQILRSLNHSVFFFFFFFLISLDHSINIHYKRILATATETWKGQIGSFMLPLQMLTFDVRNIICKSWEEYDQGMEQPPKRNSVLSRVANINEFVSR